MRFLHIADLHIGKRVNEFSMIEDQRYILDQILAVVEREKPDGILIAGDVYDKSQPSAEAVELLDEFLTELMSYRHPVFVISGNHDSPERLGFGSQIMQKDELYIAGVFNGHLWKVTLSDEYGPVNIYMLPFVKPAAVRPFYDETIETYEQAVRAVIDDSNVDRDERNVLIAHQFISAGGQKPEQSDSEVFSIGGLDNIDSAVFEDFDYVALGHLHGPQRIGRDTIRYAGSPLKYSFSEARHHKSVVMIGLAEKGNVQYDLIPLKPLRDLREIQGPIEELLCVGREDAAFSQDYIHATLTDEDEIYDAIGQIRKVYPNLMALDFDNKRSRQASDDQDAFAREAAKKSTMELFADFYKLQNHVELSAEQITIMKDIFEKAGGER